MAGRGCCVVNKRRRSKEIPEDLMIEILLRLPVKSLLRFRCVCKSWCSLLKSPSFVNNHLNMRNSNSTGTLLVSYYNNTVEKRLFSFLSAETLLDASNGKHIQFPEEDYSSCMEVIGSCNGIYCLSSRDRPLLWNPATREVKVLPNSDVPKPPDYRWINYRECGFGFDPKTNDYKVVRLLMIELKCSILDDPFDDYGREMMKQIELYSHRTDSWRELDVDEVIFPRGGLKIRSVSLYMNGRYHWWVDNGPRGKTDSILSFDMGDEEFRTMPLPDLFKYDRKYYLRNIAVLNECMTAIFFPYHGENCYEIWVMHEYGVKESWTKEYVVGPIYGARFYGPFRLRQPIAFWKNDGGLFLNDENRQLILYDPADQKTKDLQINGGNKPLYVLNYAESLVSLQGRPELEEHILRADDI